MPCLHFLYLYYQHRLVPRPWRHAPLTFLASHFLLEITDSFLLFLSFFFSDPGPGQPPRQYPLSHYSRANARLTQSLYESLLSETVSTFIRCQGPHDEDEVDITIPPGPLHPGESRPTRLQHRSPELHRAIPLHTTRSASRHSDGLPESPNCSTDNQTVNWPIPHPQWLTLRDQGRLGEGPIAQSITLEVRALLEIQDQVDFPLHPTKFGTPWTL